MSKLEALLFDVDGTLADTERDGHRLAFNAAFDEAGLDWDWTPEIYGDLLSVTGGKERIRYFLQKYLPGFDLPDAPDEWIAGLHAAKTRYYTDMLAEGHIPVRPGVRRLLHEARDAGLRLAIATTTTPANVTALLEHALEAGSTEWFEVIAAGDIVPAKKPASDIYDYALEKLSLPAANCLAFEDSRNGILSSMGAGLKTLITVNAYTRNDDFTGAVAVLDQLGEPDQPFEVLSGEVGEATCVDVALLEKLHRN
jgi:HAD superfamily hydrolase (TIGR01509 family)